MSTIAENIASIRAQMAEAAKKAGRDPSEILLCAATKMNDADRVKEAVAAGIDCCGENRVQEIQAKRPLGAYTGKPLHFIGHLQTNKVKYIIDKVCMIHSVDSLKLAEEIDKRAAQHGITMDILIQVNSAQEESKFGITTGETGQMIRDILASCPHVKIRGLMCIAPFEDNPEDAGQYFAAVKALYDEYAKMQHPNLDFKYLSMGMSNDFEVAIENGSNLIRVGTSIFGARDYSKK